MIVSSLIEAAVNTARDKYSREHGRGTCVRQVVTRAYHNVCAD